MLVGSTGISVLVMLSAAGSREMLMATFNFNFVCLVFYIGVPFLLLVYCK